MRGNCLVIVDFQNDFVSENGALTFDNGKGDSALIKRMENFLKLLPKNYFESCIVTYDTHSPENYFQTNEGKLFPLHCAKNTKGWHLAINPALILNKIEKVQHLKKNTFDMWEETIDVVDKDILQSAKNVVLVGVASDICNKAALDGWLKKGVRVTIIDDLTRGIFEQTKDVIAKPEYQIARATGQLQITTTQDFLNRFKNMQKGRQQ